MARIKINWQERITMSLGMGFMVGLLATELLQPYIYFSLFVGIPAGIASAIATYHLRGW